jgi:hypothetical protein
MAVDTKSKVTLERVRNIAFAGHVGYSGGDKAGDRNQREHDDAGTYRQRAESAKQLGQFFKTHAEVPDRLEKSFAAQSADGSAKWLIL